MLILVSWAFGANVPFPADIMRSIERLIEEDLGYFGIASDPAVIAQLVSYLEELGKWNRHMNLTGLEGSESIVRDLVSDGFFLHTVLPSEGLIVDLGSGAGVLAVPLAILLRSRRVLSLDKSLKKTQFQRQVKRLLCLDNLEVIHGRAQDLAPAEGDVLLAKAFGTVTQILKVGGWHVKDGASAFLVRGATDEAVEEEGFVLKEVRPYQLPKSNKTYRLFVYKKVT
jgi:16S rRNA (guanine527-N7)-methyltransferase